MNAITSFKSSEHAFLSNFFAHRMSFSPRDLALPGDVAEALPGVLHAVTLEHAYQAAKAQSAQDVLAILAAETPGRAKRMGRKITCRPRWETTRLAVMKRLLSIKFSGLELASLLLETGDQAFVEGNEWHDNFWGECQCARCAGRGENWLGRLLMLVRAEIACGVEANELVNLQEGQEHTHQVLTDLGAGKEHWSLPGRIHAPALVWTQLSQGERLARLQANSIWRQP